MDVIDRRMLMGRVLAKDFLPSAYQRVEYLQSTGTQYIDTGHIPTTQFSAEITFASNKQAGDTFEGLMGAQNTTSGVSQTGIRYSAIIISTNLALRIVSKPPTNADIDIALPTNAFVQSKHLYEFNWGTGIFSVEQYSTKVSPVENDATCNLYILARDTNGTAANFAKGLLYGFECWDGNFHMKMIPCVRKSDNKPGMYDTVSKTFFTNAGTGEFIVPQ